MCLCLVIYQYRKSQQRRLHSDLLMQAHSRTSALHPHPHPHLLQHEHEQQDQQQQYSPKPLPFARAAAAAAAAASAASSTSSPLPLKPLFTPVTTSASLLLPPHSTMHAHAGHPAAAELQPLGYSAVAVSAATAAAAAAYGSKKSAKMTSSSSSHRKKTEAWGEGEEGEGGEEEEEEEWDLDVAEQRQASQVGGWSIRLVMFVPAACDFVASYLINIGLLWIDASIWQMIRGSELVFTALIRRLWLGRKLKYSQVGRGGGATNGRRGGKRRRVDGLWLGKRWSKEG